MKDVFLLGAEDPRKALGPLRPAQLLCFAPGLEVWESLIIRLITETCSNSQILKVPPPFLSWGTYSFQRWDKDIPWGENYFSPCSCGPIQTESHPDETPWELCIQGHIKPWVVSRQGRWNQASAHHRLTSLHKELPLLAVWPWAYPLILAMSPLPHQQNGDNDNRKHLFWLLEDCLSLQSGGRSKCLGYIKLYKSVLMTKQKLVWICSFLKIV